MRKIIGVAVMATTLCMGAAPAQVEEWVARVDRDKLAHGELHLGLFYEGEQDGFMRFGWDRNGDQITIWDRSMFATGELYETMEVNLSAEDLSPQDFHIQFHQGSMIVVLDGTYEEARVHGSMQRSMPGQPDANRDFEAELPVNAWARATTFVFAAVASMQVGERFSYTWFSPMSGGTEDVTLSAVEAVEVETPAGTFQTVRIEQRGGSPANDIFVDTESGTIVRIDIGGMPMQFLALADETSSAQ
ncbi:MAG: hypothetical protein P8J78_12010 [Maricaulis sp.]|nr:hypothetical protein [Maricaulis sp.]